MVTVNHWMFRPIFPGHAHFECVCYYQECSGALMNRAPIFLKILYKILIIGVKCDIIVNNKIPIKKQSRVKI